MFTQSVGVIVGQVYDSHKVGVGGRYSPPRDMFGTVPGLTLPRSTSGDTASQYGARRAPWIPPPPRALSAFPTRTLSESPNVCVSVTLMFGSPQSIIFAKSAC